MIYLYVRFTLFHYLFCHTTDVCSVLSQYKSFSYFHAVAFVYYVMLIAKRLVRSDAVVVHVIQTPIMVSHTAQNIYVSLKCVHRVT